MGMTNTLIIGAVTDYQYKDIAPWLNSLKMANYKGDIALIAYNMSRETSERLTRAGVTYIFAMGKGDDGNIRYPVSPMFNICVERFAHLWYFLKNAENQFDYVLTTDVKDVVFQNNPFNWIRDYDNGKNALLVGSENIRYEDEPWGRNNMQIAFGKMMYEEVAKKPIYCAGVIGGTRKTFSDLCLNIFLLCRGCPSTVPGGGGPDQAALNLLLATTYSWATKLSVLDGFVCHAGTTIDAIEAGSGEIGEQCLFDPSKLDGYRRSLIHNGPSLLNGQVSTAFGVPYSIVHQYDRVPLWKEKMLQRYGEE